MPRMRPAELEDLRRLFAEQRNDELVARCEQALSVDPDQPRVLEILALALARRGRRQPALALLARARRLAPGDAQINYNLAVTLQEAGQPALAMLRYRDCLRADPGHADALWNYGELLRVNDRFTEALALFDHLRAQHGNRPDLAHRRAVCQAHLGHDDDARASFEEALSGNSTEPALSHWEYAHFLLMLGEYADGFLHYDHRFDAAARTAVHCQDFPYPRWQGEPLHGRSILLHGEQGLGDEIMFASVATELVEEADRLVVACQPPLVRLLAHSLPAAQVVPHRVGESPADPEGPFDYAVALGSLCRHRRRRRADFCATAGGYLGVAESEKTRLRHCLDQVAPVPRGTLRIGLAWCSNPAHGVQWGARRARRKSISSAALGALRRRPGVQFVSLHNVQNGAEAAHVPQLDLVDMQDWLGDLADTAALIANLDLVISVDTSVAHLAGALGAPTWILLMQHCDWRWGREGDRTPWYDSARLFRQQRDGDWDGVIEALANALDDFCARPAPAPR